MNNPALGSLIKETMDGLPEDWPVGLTFIKYYPDLDSPEVITTLVTVKSEGGVLYLRSSVTGGWHILSKDLSKLLFEDLGHYYGFSAAEIYTVWRSDEIWNDSYFWGRVERGMMGEDLEMLVEYYSNEVTEQ